MLHAAPIEIDQHKVEGVHRIEPVAFPQLPTVEGDARPSGERQTYFEGAGYVATSVYRGEDLRPGNTVEGPAIVQRMGDSVVVPPGASAQVDSHMTLHMRSVPPPQTVEMLASAAGA